MYNRLQKVRIIFVWHIEHRKSRAVKRPVITVLLWCYLGILRRKSLLKRKKRTPFLYQSSFFSSVVEWGCLRSHTFCTIYSLFCIVYGQFFDVFTSEKIYFFGKQPIGKWRNGQGISRKYCRIRRLTYSFQRYFIPLTEPTFSDTIIPKNKIEKL